MELTCGQRRKPGNGYGLSAEWILFWYGLGILKGSLLLISREHHLGWGLSHLEVETQNGWGNPAGPKGQIFSFSWKVIY